MDSQPFNGLKDVLTHEKLQALREFWFEHLTSDDDRVIPKPEQQRRWFFSDKEFDSICVSRFSPILEAIRSGGITSADQILAIAQPCTPLDWLSLIILLDQIPRNSYRGDSASLCFSYFDPLAVQLTTRAIDLGIPDAAPELRWQFAHRNWFYMPLMHSEDLAAHGKAAAEFGRMEEDVLSLLEGEGGENEHERRARQVVQGDPETAKALAKINVEFERKHQVIIERFGRYPHRNKALGRESTKEEVEYLENGGDVFSA
ncbi:hypothetical protein ACJ41O_003872 [Fusarium nematophilum]